MRLPEIRVGNNQKGALMEYLTDIQETDIRARIAGMTIYELIDAIWILSEVINDLLTNPVPSPDAGENSVNGELSGFDTKGIASTPTP